MAKGIFREKSIQRISSPESLNEYIKVTGPTVWSVLLAIVVLLIGVCVWGVIGHLDTQISAVCVSQNGEAVCLVSEEDIADINSELTVRIGTNEYSIVEIPSNPNKVTDEYIIHKFDDITNLWVYEIKIDANLQDGIYDAYIITESVSPMSFVTN